MRRRAGQAGHSAVVMGMRELDSAWQESAHTLTSSREQVIGLHNVTVSLRALCWVRLGHWGVLPAEDNLQDCMPRDPLKNTSGRGDPWRFRSYPRLSSPPL